MPPDAGDVLLFRLPFAELPLQLALCRFGQGHHNHAAGRHIQPVHRLGLREVALNARHHAVFVLGKPARHGQQAAWLVDHHNVLILVENNQPGILRRIVVFHRHIRVPLLVGDHD